MSERILRALMQLFAILAKVDYSSSNSSTNEEFEISEQRKVVEGFLLSELSQTLTDQYLKIFDENIETLSQSKVRKDGAIKKASLNSVKILRICSEINKELTLIQKKIVLIRILEFVKINEYASKQISDFVDTVADSFNIVLDNFRLLQAFVNSDLEQRIDDPRIAYVTNKKIQVDLAKNITLSGLDNEIRILRLESVGYLFLKYFGSDNLVLNGQTVPNNRILIFSQGASVRTSKSSHIYYSDVVSRFLRDTIQEEITMDVHHLSYNFDSGKTGVHEVTFSAEGGQLIGLMGGSGAGKSTFINLLNGNLSPSSGSVSINGINIHNEKKKLEGKIGFISQDDLLIEELTVYDNLFYNTRLCFKSNSPREIHIRVLKALHEVGLYDVKRLKVGSVMEKSISGGQRKRLNIALELIREPAVLYVDEPTSGLSSRDSEKIMDLLKELTLKGKLIYVVIHQPSSDIFKMFDRLFIMDNGGYLIYDGKPSDATVYFKVHANHVAAHERECVECGNVNPEEIFNIIESKVVDEFGNLTSTRKTNPIEWFRKFNNANKHEFIESARSEFKADNTKPSKWSQFKVYLQRDLFSKLANKQYVLINLLEAPVLALFLSYFLKYFGTGSGEQLNYSLYHNENIPQYLFICVIVSIFLGLAVSAEEIIKDKLLLKREQFLNLSRTSYLGSKVSIQFLISFIQSGLFVFIGNFVLEIPGLWWEFWLILFSTSCMANMLGLLVSSAFRTAKVVYIFIPLLIIPQLLFSGVIVKYDKLHPFFSSEKSVPLIGNSMASRWAYEALAVSMFLNNPNEKEIFKEQLELEESSWKKDYWLPEMQHILTSEKDNSDVDNENQRILINEIKKEELVWVDFKCDACINENQINYEAVSDFLQRLKVQYDRSYKNSSSKIDQIKLAGSKTAYDETNLVYSNESLERLVKNSNEIEKIVRSKDELVQKSNPIYRYTTENGFFNNPLYVPSKSIFGVQVSTLWANIFVIWMFSLALYILLYFDLARLLIALLSVKK
jgi:ABC-type multidrug transport system ATPase subunit